jgi:hypothetical protein
MRRQTARSEFQLPRVMILTITFGALIGLVFVLEVVQLIK